MTKPTEKDIREALEWVNEIRRACRDYWEHSYCDGCKSCEECDRHHRTLRYALKGIDAVIKKATEMMNCSHELCSMDEAAYEEIHGEMFLNIVNSCCGGIEEDDE